jgi:hypothetical protein
MALEAQGMHFLRMHASLQDHVSQANPFLWKLTAKRMTEQPEYCRKMLSNKDIIVLVVHDSETETNVGVGLGGSRHTSIKFLGYLASSRAYGLTLSTGERACASGWYRT